MYEVNVYIYTTRTQRYADDDVEFQNIHSVRKRTHSIAKLFDMRIENSQLVVPFSININFVFLFEIRFSSNLNFLFRYKILCITKS